MMTLIAIIHIVVAVVLIGLVLIQDSKGGALGIGGGSTSQSLLGATGAQTLAAKLTQVVAVIFAITCIALSLMTSKSSTSVVDALPPAAVAPTTPATETAPAAPTAPANNDAAAQTTAPAAPAPEAKK